MSSRIEFSVQKDGEILANGCIEENENNAKVITEWEKGSGLFESVQQAQSHIKIAAAIEFGQQGQVVYTNT
ncbi:MAG: hypothetical protein OES84_02895 [Kiritimatiellaceae bacterium]|nr:hypothetical protein [Kiritimatiellaceae bacterium]